MPKNDVKKTEATPAVEPQTEIVSDDIRRLNEYIDDQYRTDFQTLPAINVSQVLDPAKQEMARRAYEVRVNPNPSPDDIMDEAGTRREDLENLYRKGVPLPNNAELDNDTPVKHTIDVRLDENGSPVIEVASNREGEEPVIIATPPTNPSPAAGTPTDTSSTTPPIALSAFPTEQELVVRASREEISQRESAAADATRLEVTEENEMPTGNARPTVAATPVPSTPASSPSNVPVDENNSESK